MVKKITTNLKKIKKITFKPKQKHSFVILEKKYHSPKVYSNTSIKKFSTYFSELSNSLRIRELPINPNEIRLNIKDPLYSQKSKFVAQQNIRRITGEVNPRRLGNIYEIKLELILKNKKFTKIEKQQHLQKLIAEIESFKKTNKIELKIREMETEVSKNVDKVTNIFKEIEPTIKSTKLNSLEKKETKLFLEQWKKNLRNVDALLREYKQKINNLDLIVKKINIELTK